MSIASFLGEQSLTVVVGHRPRNIPRTHPHFEEIVALVQDPEADEDFLLELLDPLSPIRDLVIDGSSIEIHETTVTRNGEALPSYLQRRIVDTVKAGLPVEPWKLFVERVYANPSFQSRYELALFMEKSGLPMTPEGKFLAYKRVREDYRDTYSGTFDNSIGRVVTMPGGRKNVDDDRNRTCSTGLHFCSQGYLKSFYTGSGRIMIVEIDPADVVSIPSDYDNTKGRTWRYTVVGEVPLSTEAEAAEWGVLSMDYLNEEALEQTLANIDRLSEELTVALSEGNTREADSLREAIDDAAALVVRIREKLEDDERREAECKAATPEACDDYRDLDTLVNQLAELRAEQDEIYPWDDPYAWDDLRIEIEDLEELIETERGRLDAEDDEADEEAADAWGDEWVEDDDEGEAPDDSGRTVLDYQTGSSITFTSGADYIVTNGGETSSNAQPLTGEQLQAPAHEPVNPFKPKSGGFVRKLFGR